MILGLIISFVMGIYAPYHDWEPAYPGLGASFEVRECGISAEEDGMCD